MAGYHRPQGLRASLALGVAFFAAPTISAITSQFQNFYPQHGDKYEYLLQHNCSQQFANYLTGRPQDFPLDWLGGGGHTSVLVEPVVKCLLDNISEYIKAASSSAQVLLGVTPTLLSLLGASTDELAMLTVVGRRPFLSFLLSLGSPSVYLTRTFEYTDPLNPLKDRENRYPPKEASGSRRWFIAIVQYTLAVAAAANIATLNWQLGLGTVCAFWSNTIFAPLVWGVLAVPIFFAGTFALRLRVRRVYADNEPRHVGLWQWLRRTPQRLYDFTKSEWTPAAAQDEVRVLVIGERRRYIVWSWLLSTTTIIHILFGTLLFSSLQFIGPQDALGVILRYMGSVLVCRGVIVYEIAGMRSKYVPGTNSCRQPYKGNRSWW